ncbi:MAG: type II secretion system protein [Candidatus Pacebacteria bacterium]|nr:type II secretion system protein [Candidatus Paceibacterota bacterium]
MMKKNQEYKAGFTLIEMVVTVAIFAIISTIVIVRNASFDNEVLLNNLAYDIALSVRQAQQFGVNVRVSEGQFDASYGIRFEDESDTYMMFTDLDEDNAYDAPGELIETFTLGRGATIQTICDIEAEDCSLSTMDIVFRRPEPDAIINNGLISRAQIELVSARQQGRRYIVIESTGQIAIERPENEEEAETGFDEGGGAESEGR